MDNLGTEVSNKIRSAIKAKLIELDSYVDDELPDYIMVMVANDRTEIQMNEDLGLFLNDHTKAFTKWLHNVLDKLKKVTLDEVAKKETKKKKVKDKDSKKKEKKKDKSTVTKGKEKDKAKKKKVEKVVTKDEKSGKEANANKIELGTKKKKIKEMESDEEDLNRYEVPDGGGYDPEAILKNAVKCSAKSLKVSTEKRETPTRKIKKKINTKKEEQQFFKPNKTIRARSRSRSYSVERVGPVSSQVQVVKKRRSRSRSLQRKSVASKVILPPRPNRSYGREEKGVARVLSRSIHDAGRSMRRGGHTSSEYHGRGYRSPDYRSRSISFSPERRRAPRLSPADIERYNLLKQSKKNHKEKETKKKKSKDKEKIMARKLKREVDLLTTRQLAMDMELQKLTSKRPSKSVVNLSSEGEEDEVRIIIRRDDSEEKVTSDQESRQVRKSGKKVVIEEEDEEENKEESPQKDEPIESEVEEERTVSNNLEEDDLDEQEEVVERKIYVEEENEEDDKPSPPKKIKTSEKQKPSKGEELDDVELQEMRRKALESLKRKREAENRDGKEVSKQHQASHSDQSSDSDSETSLSESSDEDFDIRSGASTTANQPTFIVTMDGIDEKYFKEGPTDFPKKNSDTKEKIERPKSRGTKRHSPLDDSLELYTEESFDSPSHTAATSQYRSISRQSSQTEYDHKDSEKPITKTISRNNRQITSGAPTSTKQISSGPVASSKESNGTVASNKQSSGPVATSKKSSGEPATSKQVLATSKQSSGVLATSKQVLTTSKQSSGVLATSKQVLTTSKQSSGAVTSSKQTSGAPTSKTSGPKIQTDKNPTTTESNPVIKSKLTDSARPIVAKKSENPKTVVVKKVLKRPAPAATPTETNTKAKTSQIEEKKTVVITSDGKTIVTKQVVPTKPVKPKTKIIIRKVSSSEEASESKVKPKFTPVTAPTGSIDSPVNKPLNPITYTTTVYSKPQIGSNAGSSSICKFYPNCARGSLCFYYHPKPGTQGFIAGGSKTFAPAAPVNRFKWRPT